MGVTLWGPALSGFAATGVGPLVGGKVYFYDAGTTDPRDTYPTRADAQARTNPNTNPVVLDSRGSAQVWLNGLYKAAIKTSSDVTLYTVDGIGDDIDVDVLPQGYGTGLELTSTGNRTVSCANGRCKDIADSFDLVVSTPITGDLDASGAGGLDSGSVGASSGYYVHLIGDSSGVNPIAALFSLSETNPTIPDGYDKRALIGFVVTDGSSNIRPFAQTADYVSFDSAFLGLQDTTITSETFETATLPVPARAVVTTVMQTTTNTAGGRYVAAALRPTGSSASFGDSSAQNLILPDSSTGAGRASHVVQVNGNRQLDYAASEPADTTTLRLFLVGFRMLTRFCR